MLTSGTATNFPALAGAAIRQIARVASRILHIVDVLLMSPDYTDVLGAVSPLVEQPPPFRKT
jgi:hypothetical protein